MGPRGIYFPPCRSSREVVIVVEFQSAGERNSVVVVLVRRRGWKGGRVAQGVRGGHALQARQDPALGGQVGGDVGDAHAEAGAVAAHHAHADVLDGPENVVGGAPGGGRGRRPGRGRGGRRRRGRRGRPGARGGGAGPGAGGGED